jgi:hypothetical protein
VERSLFTLLVMSTTGSMVKQSIIFYKRLATLISTKRESSYNLTINWLRCQISFCLLRSAIQCIRGARSSYHSPGSWNRSDLLLQILQCTLLSVMQIAETQWQMQCYRCIFITHYRLN